MFSINPFISMMSKVFIFSLTILLMACDPNSSGGVIVVDDAPTIPVVGGPYSPGSSDPTPILPPSTLDTPYDFRALQDLIDATPSGGVLELDKDVLLKFSVDIVLPITIKPAPGKDVSIIFRDFGKFNIYSQGVTVSSLTFDVDNNNAMFQGQINSSTELTLEKNVVIMKSLYEQLLSFSNLNLINNSFIGLCDFCFYNNPLLTIQSNSGLVQGNLFVATNNKYSTALMVQQSKNLEISYNVFKANTPRNSGTVRMDTPELVIFKGNYIQDSNYGKYNDYNTKDVFNPEGAPPLVLANFTGTVGLFLEGTTMSVSDEGERNNTSATYDHLGTHLSIENGANLNPNVVLSSFGDIPVFENDKIFNYLPTLDLHLICSSQNPAFKTVAIPGWQEYYSSQGSIYYAGAVIPACL